MEIRQFRGKVVYVDFWASWCTSCVMSFPFLNDLDRDFRDRGLQVVGINLDEKPADAKATSAKHPARFAIAADRNGVCPKSFDVRAMPVAYVIDRRGIVRHQHVGFRPGQAEEMRTLVSTLLAEPETSQ